MTGLREEEIMATLKSVAELDSLRERLLAAPDLNRPVVRICLGPGCLAQGADKVSRAFRATIKAKNIPADVKPLLKETGCHGFCSQGPLINLAPFDLFYVGVKPEDVPDIVDYTLRDGKVMERLLYHDNGHRYQSAAEVPFYKLQQKIILRNVGLIDPLDIDDAIQAGAYRSLAKALTKKTTDQIIETVTVSGLRGRGGGGFPTGYKWRKAVEYAQENAGPVFVVGNGDEGDPGAFMDRAIMEGDPHAVLEGMAIGALAMGAEQGYLYVRAEYPFAVKTLNIAIEQARRRGLLGQNILGTGFNFDVQINRGAGAFVCGEETALLASIEGRVGEPITRPPYPVEQGLWGRPTVINNVETWANVPHIIDRGAQWYAGLGVPHSTGTKIFSLVGKVKNSGLVEVPMGITLGAIVEEIGGGVPGAARFKAVQTGGPSGGIIPYELKELPPEEIKLDQVGLQPRGFMPVELKNLPVDFDSLAQAGSIMGSGGMIVMDDHDCVVDVARYFLRFLEEESCGKCLPCRLGLKGMQEFLNNFSQGQGAPEDIEALESLGKALVDGSLCGLGRTAPNPVLTSIRYFRDEYLAHIVDHKCPAGVCRDLITYRIAPDLCNGCTLCAQTCPQECITGKKKKPHTIDQTACIRCGACMDVCPVDAVVVD
jgi:NADP-reducing hydrogenase subunit HndC